MSIARAGYLAAWRAMRRYFRYEVEGFENLEGDGAALIVGYHGRPIAYDLCILLVEVYERLGYFPHGIVHTALGVNSRLRSLQDELGFVTGDGPELRRAVENGEHLVVVPGGTREGCRAWTHRYRVDWGRRMGYLRLAHRYGLDLVPVAASGIDDAYWGLNDGYRWGKRLNLPWHLPFWLGIGPLGFWPWSPPFPVKIRQKIGPRIRLSPTEDPIELERQHEQIVSRVQSLLHSVRMQSSSFLR